jgi:hypothetical protein
VCHGFCLGDLALSVVAAGFVVDVRLRHVVEMLGGMVLC